MQQASIPSFGFFFMLALATVIATFGLISNSAPAIIGAMIIAPLMAPIMSLAYGFVAFERRLISRSIVSVIAGMILVVVLAYISTVLIGLRITGSEILNRTSPTLIDLGIAMAAGGAAAFAYTRQSIVSSIAGVAIAVALVPPLAVCGIGLALGRRASTETGLSLSEFGLYSGGTDVAAGAFLLFVTNLIGIIAIAILVFISQRYGKWKHALLALLLFVTFSALLIPPLNHALHRLYVKSKIVRLLTKLSAQRTDIVSGRGKIDSIQVSYRDGLLHVNIDGLSPKDTMDDAQRRADVFRQFLSVEIGEPLVLELDMIPVEMVQIRSEPGEMQLEKKSN
jgi:uncharacterized hydrophobic protein (TIGR00271 family)